MSKLYHAFPSPAAKITAMLTLMGTTSAVHSQPIQPPTPQTPAPATTTPSPPPAPTPLPQPTSDLTSPPAVEGPCDILEKGGNPCVAAHSTVRLLYSKYTGPLYDVTTNNGTGEAFSISAGPDQAEAQGLICIGTLCRITKIYDQSGRGNHLGLGPKGGVPRPADVGALADAESITIMGGRKAYSLYTHPGMGYRNDTPKGTAKGWDSETIYMVTSGTHYSDKCCFDYGNAETNNDDDGPGTMEAVNIGNYTGHYFRGAEGPGPWVSADLENGLYASSDNQQIAHGSPSMTQDFVTAMVKGRYKEFALKVGDAQQKSLNATWDGPRPGGYTPMRLQGAIILGIGGDNSNWAFGTFYEGVMAQGWTDDATDMLIQTNIAAVGYQKVGQASNTSN